MRKKSGNILLIILVTVGLLAASVGGYFWWTASTKTPIIRTAPTIKPSDACITDNDCVVGVQANTNCCHCPKVINKSVLGKDHWEIYIKGKDYNQNNQSCSNVACKPCEYLGFNPPVCSSEKCIQGTDLPVKMVGFCGGIAGVRCPSGYTCQLDGNYPDAGGKCVLENTPSEKFTTGMCPKNGWLDCMPILTPESKRECDNIEWFKKNCPNFQGVTY